MGFRAFGVTLWDPMDCSPPGSSGHGICRQEQWSGLPFPTLGTRNGGEAVIKMF